MKLYKALNKLIKANEYLKYDKLSKRTNTSIEYAIQNAQLLTKLATNQFNEYLPVKVIKILDMDIEDSLIEAYDKDIYPSASQQDREQAHIYISEAKELLKFN